MAKCIGDERAYLRYTCHAIESETSIRNASETRCVPTCAPISHAFAEA